MEARRKRRLWLPRWCPGNVEILVYRGDEMTFAEADEMACEFIATNCAYAVVIEDDERTVGYGAVTVRPAVPSGSVSA